MQSHLGYPDSQRWQCGGRAMPWWIPIKFQLPARVQGCTCYNAKHKKKTCRLERSSIPEIVSVVTIILDSSSHSFLHHWVPRHPSDRYMDEQHTHSHVEGVFLSKGTTFEACISLFWIKRLWLKMSDAKVQRVLRFQISILGPILTGPWTVPHLNSMKLTYKHHVGHQKIWFTACKLKMTCGIKNLARYHSNSLALLNFNLLNFCPFGMETQHIL